MSALYFFACGQAGLLGLLGKVARDNTANIGTHFSSKYFHLPLFSSEHFLLNTFLQNTLVFNTLLLNTFHLSALYFFVCGQAGLLGLLGKVETDNTAQNFFAAILFYAEYFFPPKLCC